MATESQDSRSECRRCREHGYIERGVDQEGHEAEESPSNKRAMRARGEGSLELQGVQRLSARSSAPKCKECGGASVCEHGRVALSARSAVGHQSASTVVIALIARSAVGLQSVSTVVCALHARSAVGHIYASTVVSALSARSAVVRQSASTVVSVLRARSAVGRQSASTVVSAMSARSAVGQESASTVVSALTCKECGGAGSICEHGRRTPY